MLTPEELAAMREREAGTTDEACCEFNYEVRFDFPRLLDEVERLQKIEAAARAYLAVKKSWDNSGYKELVALKAALEGGNTNG